MLDEHEILDKVLDDLLDEVLDEVLVSDLTLDLRAFYSSNVLQQSWLHLRQDSPLSLALH